MSWQSQVKSVQTLFRDKGELFTRRNALYEFTPLSLIPERLAWRSDPLTLPHRWALFGSAALQSSLHERSFCLSVSGWIAPSAAGDNLAHRPLSPVRGRTIARGGRTPQVRLRCRPASQAESGLAHCVIISGFSSIAFFRAKRRPALPFNRVRRAFARRRRRSSRLC